MANQVQWFFRKDNKNFGPFSAQQLKQLAEASTISRDTLVRRAIDDKWIPARKVQGLFSTPSTANAPFIPVAATVVANPRHSVPPKPPIDNNRQPSNPTAVSTDPQMAQPNQQVAPSRESSIAKKVLHWFIMTLIGTSITFGVVLAVRTAIKQNMKNKIKESIQKSLDEMKK